MKHTHNQIFTVHTHTSAQMSYTHRLLSVHALIEVLKLELAFLLGTGLTNAIRTLDPLLLKGVAAGCPFIWLLSTLDQHPFV